MTDRPPLLAPVRRVHLLTSTLAGSGIAIASSLACAGNFDITANSTSAQTLGSGSGQSGVIEQGVSLSVSGSTVAVTISGNSATLTNLGTLTQTGTGRAIRDNTGVTNLVVTNGSTTNSTALMQAADADVIQMNKSPASVTLNNYGQMISLNASAGGSQAVDFNAIASGSNIINNFSGALMKATDADAVRPGVSGVVYNAGTMLSVITAAGSGSDGVDAQNNTGVQITNDSGGLIEGGRHGITGGAVDNTVAFTTSVTNNLNAIIRGDNGSGINLDGFNAKQTASIFNVGTIIGNGVTGDGDGIDVDGVITLTNTGTIKSLNSFSSTTPAQSEGVTVGGGSIINSGLIEGDVAAGNLNAVGRGITLAGVDTSGTAEPIYANSVITNQSNGIIRGQSDSAIAVDGGASGFTVTINNNAGGLIQGGGTAAAIRTGFDNDTINNAGTIDGSISGKAIDMGAGNNVLSITGGSASILGSINGGTGGINTMTIDPGPGNGFAYSGSISNFDSVEVRSGHVTLSGVSSYGGATVLSGGTLTLDGANRLSTASTLNLNGGALSLAHAGGADGQTFASLALGESSAIDLGLSSLTFNGLGSVGGGKTLSVIDWSAATSPDYAFRFLGDDTGSSAFLTLIGATTIDGFAAGFHFDGTYTDVAPVPIPAAWTLLASALGLLAAAGRRWRIEAIPA